MMVMVKSMSRTPVISKVVLGIKAAKTVKEMKGWSVWASFCVVCFFSVFKG